MRAQQRMQLRRAAYLRIIRCGQLTEEVFGPVLHVVRYRADELDGVLRSIERSGFGLTLGIHSRIDDTVEAVIDRLAAASRKAANDLAIIERLQRDGVDPVGGTPAQFGALIARELPQWRELARAANIKLQ